MIIVKAPDIDDPSLTAKMFKTWISRNDVQEKFKAFNPSLIACLRLVNVLQIIDKNPFSVEGSMT